MCAHVWSISVELFVSVRPCVRSLGDPSEAIQIQLALKGRQFGMAEIARQNILHESFGVSYNESISFG